MDRYMDISICAYRKVGGVLCTTGRIFHALFPQIFHTFYHAKRKEQRSAGFPEPWTQIALEMSKILRDTLQDCTFSHQTILLSTENSKLNLYSIFLFVLDGKINLQRKSKIGMELPAWFENRTNFLFQALQHQ